MLSFLIHGLGLTCFGVCFYWILFIVSTPAAKVFPGRWMYLTLWNVIVQLIYHVVALLNDVWGSNELDTSKISRLQRFRDWLFACWAFPVGVFVSALFWGLFAFDPSHLFDVDKEVYFPEWVNQLEHTGPVVILMLDLLIVPKLLPGWKIGLTTNLGFSITYLAWITWVHSQYGVWAYPMLEKMNFMERCGFHAGCCLTMIVFYLLGAMFNRCRLKCLMATGNRAEIGTDLESNRT